MAMPTGISRPPPTPWSARNTTSCARVWDSPHRAEAAVNTATAKSSTRFVPKRSPSQPEARMNPARRTTKLTATAVVSCGVTWNWRASVAKATLTIVMSIACMKMART